MWQPIETAPKDQFLLLCGLSGYTTTPMVVTTGRMCSDYHAGRWIDHANDDLTDWGFTPTHWAPLTLPGAQPAPSVPDGFSREDLEAVADGLDGYEKTVNVGNVTGEGDDHLESTTAYAARFIRTMLAAAPEAKP